MLRSLVQRVVSGSSVLLLLVVLMTGCRMEDTPSPAVPIGPDQPQSTAVPTMRPTQPLPTAAAEAIPTKATTAGEGFSLLILHTSEVLGEVNPCG